MCRPPLAPALFLAFAILLLVVHHRPHVHAATSLVKPPSPISLSFPPFSRSTLLCQFDESLNLTADLICTPSTPPGRVVFSNDNDVISARYQYKKPVQLWKKGSPYAASFSTQFTLQFDRDSERSVKRVFGGGIAFAITPTIDVDDSGPESFGLFKIEDASGKPAGRKNPQTVAVEIDTSRDVTYSWDPQIPHVGLDINSVNSVASKFLWNGTEFIDRKIAVFIDYDAQKEAMGVRFQNVSASGKADKSKSTLFLSYSGINLASYVKEMSYVGFASRVPVTTDGTYSLYDWKFSTNWVLKKRHM